jgi:hypothetical protein
MSIHLRLVDGEPQPPSAEHLVAILAIDEALGEVARCVNLLASADRPQIEVSLVGSNLLHLLSLIERSAGVEDAVDALYDAAQRMAWDAERGKLPASDRRHSLGMAYSLLRSRVLAARPRL